MSVKLTVLWKETTSAGASPKALAELISDNVVQGVIQQSGRTTAVTIERADLEGLLAERRGGARSALQVVKDGFTEVEMLREKGVSWAEIAELLGRNGAVGRDGKPFTAATVRAAFFLVGAEIRQGQLNDSPAEFCDPGLRFGGEELPSETDPEAVAEADPTPLAGKMDEAVAAASDAPLEIACAVEASLLPTISDSTDATAEPELSEGPEGLSTRPLIVEGVVFEGKALEADVVPVPVATAEMAGSLGEGLDAPRESDASAAELDDTAYDQENDRLVASGTSEPVVDWERLDDAPEEHCKDEPFLLQPATSPTSWARHSVTPAVLLPTPPPAPRSGYSDMMLLMPITPINAVPGASSADSPVLELPVQPVESQTAVVPTPSADTAGQGDDHLGIGTGPTTPPVVVSAPVDAGVAAPGTARVNKMHDTAMAFDWTRRFDGST